MLFGAAAGCAWALVALSVQEDPDRKPAKTKVDGLPPASSIGGSAPGTRGSVASGVRSALPGVQARVEASVAAIQARV